MNLTGVLALLELKGVISRDEAEKMNEFFSNRPQSTMVNDAVEQVKELLGEVKGTSDMVVEQVKPVIESAKEDIAKVGEKTKQEVEDIAKAIESQAKKSTDTSKKK